MILAQVSLSAWEMRGEWEECLGTRWSLRMGFRASVGAVARGSLSSDSRRFFALIASLCNLSLPYIHCMGLQKGISCHMPFPSCPLFLFFESLLPKESPFFLQVIHIYACACVCVCVLT